MNEGLADGAGDFNVFSALNGDVNFQDLSSEIDDDATELNLVEAVASGDKIAKFCGREFASGDRRARELFVCLNG